VFPPRRYISLSVLLHLLVLLLIVKFNRTSFNFNQNFEVYSVSIEGGSKLGGHSQVPEEKDFSKKTVVEEKPREKEPVITEAEKEKLKNTLQEDISAPAPTLAPSPKPTKPPTPKPVKTPAKKPSPTPTPRTEPKIKIDSDYDTILKRYLGESTDAGGEGIGAGRISSEKGLGGGILKDPVWLKYRNTVLEILRNNWIWQDKQSNLQAVISFRVAPDGKISQVVLETSSGNSAFDSSCLNAVAKSNPLPPPPQQYYKDFEFLRITFAPKLFLSGDF